MTLCGGLRDLDSTAFDALTAAVVPLVPSEPCRHRRRQHQSGFRTAVMCHLGHQGSNCGGGYGGFALQVESAAAEATSGQGVSVEFVTEIAQ